jgi:hypothetical protein
MHPMLDLIGTIFGMPVLLVPLFLLIHLVIAVKLRRTAAVLPLVTES